MEIIHKAQELLASCEEIALASVNTNGCPRICAVSKIKSEGIHHIWISTGMCSEKVKHFLENSKASICCWKDDSITLTGYITVKNDREIKEEMWQDWFISHYPGGVEDPNYCILEFTTEEATLWIDKEFVTLKV